MAKQKKEVTFFGMEYYLVDGRSVKKLFSTRSAYERHKTKVFAKGNKTDWRYGIYEYTRSLFK